MGEVQEIWGVGEPKKVLTLDEKNGLSEFVRSAILYGSETWCLRENEIKILRRIETAMVKAVCGAKLMEKKRTEDLRRCWD